MPVVNFEKYCQILDNAKKNKFAFAAINVTSEITANAVLEALERNGWVQQKAAREIGLTLRQMGYRVKKFGLEETIRSARKRKAAQMS